MAKARHASLVANPAAVDLGLDEPNGPSAVLAQAVEAVGESAGEAPNVLYLYLLDACEKVFAGELDQATFEEHMRWFFRTQVGLLLFIVSPQITGNLLFRLGVSHLHPG